MFKLIFLFLLIILHLNASTINFKEEKYVEIIDDTIIKYGTLIIKNEQINIQYKDSSKILTYKDDELIIKDEKTKEEIDLSKQMALKAIFFLIESIHKNNIEEIKEFFHIESNNLAKTLKPKELLKNYIKFVEFKKNAKKLEYITIHLVNGNITTIRELDD